MNIKLIVNNLLKLTMYKHITWIRKNPPSFLSSSPENAIIFYYETVYKSKTFAIYEQQEHIFSQDIGEFFIGTKFHLATIGYNELTESPSDAYIFDTDDVSLYPLYQNVKREVLDVNSLFSPDFWSKD
ncbi:hypothetical protein [Limnobaculum xujianqingii]|uniref:hypothetical protein n=1 Tax=Limnobaculum xujianqingii TaxID=2738837 RepID=UPI0015BE4350|nr:hypothetical protein [Limnobaculum xujianqingii]